jgi:peptidoglycan/LPS O-acetylase OafA/YrhL
VSTANLQGVKVEAHQEFPIVPPRSAERQGRRIAFLDGLRGVAILAVLLYHYFSRWTPPIHSENLYPYGNVLFRPFQFGFYGVELFFIVSGFVIALTLYQCESMGEFLARRFARLYPAMLVCSVLTFFVASFVPGSTFEVHGRWFLPSLTFVSPEIFNKLFSSTRFDSLDGAYWSLYVEVKFYLLVALIYFLNRRHFVRNMVSFSAATFILGQLSYVYSLSSPTRVAKLLQGSMAVLQLANNLPWFIIGIGYFLYFERKAVSQWLTLVIVGIAQLVIGSHGDMVPTATAILIPCFFFAAMENEALGKFLSLKPLTMVGVSSYSLYLLHQNIGVTLIRFFSKTLSLGVAASVVLAIAVGVTLISFSYLLFQLYEKKANKYLLRALLSGVRGCTAERRGSDASSDGAGAAA